jgi:hypothetical protein
VIYMPNFTPKKVATKSTISPKILIIVSIATY